MSIITHERVNLGGSRTGALNPDHGILWGGNAVQSITINRQTPKNPYQAIGYTGIVDYGSGAIISDAQIETILVEGCDAAVVPAGAADNSSVYRYAKQNVVLGVESYVLTGVNLGFNAGNPASVSYSWITSGLASYLDTQDQPDPSVGEESDFAVVMGDDGSGTRIVVTWDSGANQITSYVPVIDVNGVLQNELLEDGGLPAGVQSLSMSSSINRDQILDVRTSQPVQFVTTYPLDITMDMDVLVPPRQQGSAAPGDALWDPESASNFPIFDKMLDLQVEAFSLNKHRANFPSGWTGATTAAEGKIYVKAIGITKTSETESISVGQYLQYSASFLLADLIVPLPAIA